MEVKKGKDKNVNKQKYWEQKKIEKHLMGDVGIWKLIRGILCFLMSSNQKVTNKYKNLHSVRISLSLSLTAKQ